MGPCQRPYRSLGRWHWSVFPCPLLQSLHHKRPPDFSGTICLKKAMLAVLKYLCCMCLKTTFMRICSTLLLRHRGKAHQYVVPYILLYFLSENGSGASLHLTTKVLSFFIILWSKSVTIMTKSYHFLYYSKGIMWTDVFFFTSHHEPVVMNLTERPQYTGELVVHIKWNQV